MTIEDNTLSAEEITAFISVLKERFEKNMHRHQEMNWETIETKLEKDSGKLRSLYEMEASGGEPDVVSYKAAKDTYIFFDCVKETPKGRRKVCYDQEALASRKKYKPENSAQEMAASMGVKILTEAQYRYLQTLEAFDTKTSSWIETPDHIRKLGGALFCDRRYDTVFVYHNGAESYYGVRGFRASLEV